MKYFIHNFRTKECSKKKEEQKESRENGKSFIILFVSFCFYGKEWKTKKSREEQKEKLKIFEEVEIICVILCMKCIEKVFLVQNLISWHIICR